MKRSCKKPGWMDGWMDALSHTHMLPRVHVHACMFSRACFQKSAHACMHVCPHACMHACASWRSPLPPPHHSACVRLRKSHPLTVPSRATECTAASAVNATSAMVPSCPARSTT
eukprot:365717-Chlamydomonas_euryale.AAC.7